MAQTLNTKDYDKQTGTTAYSPNAGATMREFWNDNKPEKWSLKGIPGGASGENNPYGGKHWSQAELDAEKEAKRKAEEEKKRKELEKRTGIYDEIINNLASSRDRADDTTSRAAQLMASDGAGDSNFAAYGASRAASMAMADDAYNAARIIAENKLANRKTAYDEAVKSGEEKLKAAGYKKQAESFGEAATLSEAAINQSNLADALEVALDVWRGSYLNG